MWFLGLLIFVLFMMVLSMGSRTARLEQQMRDVIAAGRGLRIELERQRSPTPPASPTPPPAARSVPPIRPVTPPPPVEPRPEPAPAPRADTPAPRPMPAVRAASVSAPVVPPPVALQPAPERKPTPKAIPTALPSETRPVQSLWVNFEDLFGRRLPIWAGGITLAIAGVFIAKYAIDVGFFAKIFTPPVQVISAFLFGFGLISGAETAKRREDVVQDDRIAQALSGAGVATLYAATLVAANGYGLIGPIVAFAALALITIGALALSTRFGAPTALLGLVGGLAAPVMVTGLTQNVPLIAIYLGLTIAGLAGVSRWQRWPWLAMIAVAGGAGWSLWLILFSTALDTAGSLSLGGYVILLAMVIPMLTFEGARAPLFRGLSAIIGAGQLALLLALGGFDPLDWGLFALLAAAGQWLATRERGYAIIPSVSLALSAMLLALWFDPPLGWFITFGIVMSLIHALPLLITLWQTPARVQRARELAAIGFAILIVPAVHFYTLDGSHDQMFALLALAGSGVVAVGAAIGWNRDDRLGDVRFALLTSAAALLLAVSYALATPMWALPLGLSAIVATLLILGQRAGDYRISGTAIVGAMVTLLALISTGGVIPVEIDRLVGLGSGTADLQAILRWSSVSAMAILFAVRAQHSITRIIAQGIAAILGYGLIAQIVPIGLVPLIPPAAIIGLALGSQRLAWATLAPAIAVMGALTALWTAEPLAHWLDKGLFSLGGVGFTIDDDVFTLALVTKQLFAPAVALGVALLLLKDQLNVATRMVATVTLAILGLISAHLLYRFGFAAQFGTDFAATGVWQRLIWEGLLIGTGYAALRTQRSETIRLPAMMLIAAGMLHMLWYTLFLHNPLWAEQMVGALPIANALIVIYGLTLFGIKVIEAEVAALWPPIRRVSRVATMVIVSLFSWSLLRQAFHGSLLIDPGVFPLENGARSILAIGLAVGFLLWGISRNHRDWRLASLLLMLVAVAKVFLFDAAGLDGLMRIGSFVGLGFSLIGIGWLYSRQLGRDAARQPSSSASLTEN
ncbi:MAG: DUF2339 domain-containing protein [Sphingomonadaceae bacterium]